jgi:hypothetical protein
MGLEVIQALPPRSQFLLEQLCHEAGKDAGLAIPKHLENFSKFVIMAHEENVHLPEDALSKHLEEHGWTHDQASLAARRFIGACYVLQMYDDFHAGRLKI